MKSLVEFINENKDNKWLDAVKLMYSWYCTNFQGVYSHKRKIKYCDLIKQDVKPDCSGFIGACLCLAGYTDDAVNWNVKFGSFNDDGRPNNDDEPSNCDVDKLKYMKDISGWNPHLFNKKDIKAGDIIYASFHASIAATDGASKVYDWGHDAVQTIRGNKPVDFYQPREYKYRAYWRYE